MSGTGWGQSPKPPLTRMVPPVDEQALRDELIERIAAGLDLPVEVVRKAAETGGHWSPAPIPESVDLVIHDSVIDHGARPV